MNKNQTIKKASLKNRLIKDFNHNKYVYLMLLPVVVYFGLFHYGPIYGIQIAFKNFTVADGIWGSEWVGFKHFVDFYNSFFFWRLIRNTVLLSIYELAFSFPAPIILALLLNEIRKVFFKRIIQTVTYLPHFISLVVVIGIMIDFTASPNGLINQLLIAIGLDPINFMQDSGWFRTLFIGSGIWQSVGWSSIIYLAAIAGVNQELYEAAKIDGAGRFKQVLHVTIPGIMPTIVILFLLQIGNLFTVGYQKIILMYNPLTYETADVISTYVFRKGILEGSFSYSTAIGLIDATISFALLILFNQLSRRAGGTSLW